MGPKFKCEIHMLHISYKIFNNIENFFTYFSMKQIIQQQQMDF